MQERSAEDQIEVDGLIVHYGDVMAVKGISFAVRRGEHFTLLGPSGCGKTTTLRAIAGLEQPSAGEIRIGGRTVYSSSRRVNVPTEKRGVSMVFQSYAIWPHMTVFANVAYRLRVRRLGKKEIAENVRWALDLVEWEERQLVVRRPPMEHFEEGEKVYLVVEPEHCVLLEA
jgi:iron(III) transport system ATP-binding protein